MENYNSSNIKTLEFDALIIGGGGSGMRTSLELAKSGLRQQLFQKFFQQDRTLFQLKEELLVQLQVKIPMMIGVGICMTL